MRRVALNWMRHGDVHWAAQLVTQECVCSQETGVDWETGELRWILSGQNCNMQGHLCYLGSSAASLLSPQYNLWHISQISKLSYWIICDLDWENRGPGVVCLFEFITKTSVIHISHWTWHRARVTQGCWNAAILIIADMPWLDWVRGHEPWSSGSATWSWPLGYHQGSQNLECGVEPRSVSWI